MSGEPLPPAPDVPVMWLPGAASIRSAALYDAILQLVKRVQWIEYVMAEGSGALPPPEYLTEDEAAALFVPLTHLADANPHVQYLQQPAVQALVDAALAAHVAQADPHQTYLNVARGDARYLPITYSPPPADLSNYYTKAQADAAFLTQDEGDALFLTQDEGDLRYLPVTYVPPPSGITQADADLRYVNVAGDTMTGDLLLQKLTPKVAFRNAGDTQDALWLTNSGLYGGSGAAPGYDVQFARYGPSEWLVGGTLRPGGGYNLGASSIRWAKLWAQNADVLTDLTVASKAVALDPLAGNTLAWNTAGFYSNAPTKAQYDALLARVAALEGQMGAGANGHYHAMGSWRQTAKATLPATVLEEAPAA